MRLPSAGFERTGECEAVPRPADSLPWLEQDPVSTGRDTVFLSFPIFFWEWTPSDELEGLSQHKLVKWGGQGQGAQECSFWYASEMFLKQSRLRKRSSRLEGSVSVHPTICPCSRDLQTTGNPYRGSYQKPHSLSPAAHGGPQMPQQTNRSTPERSQFSRERQWQRTLWIRMLVHNVNVRACYIPFHGVLSLQNWFWVVFMTKSQSHMETTVGPDISLVASIWFQGLRSCVGPTGPHMPLISILGYFWMKETFL